MVICDLKKILYIVTAVLLCSCEIIREEDRLIPVPIPDTGGRTHVLIEYTGVRCVNCPKAAEMAEQLQATYGEKLIVVAMHPASNPFTQSIYDYTCPEADVYYKYMGGTASTSFPAGNIDLAKQPDGYLSDYLQWPALLASAMKEDNHLSLSCSAQLSPEKDKIHVSAEVFSIMEGQYRLAFWLTEDSVIGLQAMPDNTVNKEYCHMHMLRTTGEEVWGMPVHLTPRATSYTGTLVLPKECVPAHCHVIALLMDEEKKIVTAKQCVAN